jgi:PBP1b-binding outer membrane lipoprotein LpoB
MALEIRADSAIRRITTPCASWITRLNLVACLSLLLAGCAGIPPAPLVGRNPADPVPVAGVGYRSTIAPYQSRRPVDPAPWTEQNQRVAPAARQ